MRLPQDLPAGSPGKEWILERVKKIKPGRENDEAEYN
jgi:hypothetical protein